MRESGGGHRAAAGVAADRLRVLGGAELSGARERSERAHRHGDQPVRHPVLRAGQRVHAARPLRRRGSRQHLRTGRRLTVLANRALKWRRCYALCTLVLYCAF